MAHWFRLILLVCFGLSHSDLLTSQCGFALQPASGVRWYRADGWQIPGLSDAKAIAKINLTVNDKPMVWPDGITVSMVQHEDGYRVQFPDAIFDDDGARKRMLPRSFQLKQLLRWEVNGRPYAYSYYLWPLDIACIATIDIIDDTGDGKFRLISSPGHVILGRDPAPPPVPIWGRNPHS